MTAGPRRGEVLAWLGAFLLFAAVAHGNFESTDAGFTMHAARNLWHRGDSALLTEAQGGELLGERVGAQDIVDHQRHEDAGTGPRRHGKVGVDGRAYIWFPMGHVFLLVPFVPLAAAIERALPDADERLARAAAGYVPTVVEGTPVVLEGLIALLLPSVCMATSILLLYRIARELGASGRDAVIAALAIACTTQAFALGREQLSDGPGLTLLLAALWPVVRLHAGRGGAALAFAAGAMGGAAVLVRYQSAFAVAAFAAVLALAAFRRRSAAPLSGFVLGGAPFLAVFLLVNWARFGNPLDTGYPRVADWLDASPPVGVAKMLFAAGRGAMWLSPLLWLALPLAVQRRTPIALRWLAWVLFLAPIALFMSARGWQGGQCWAVRYITPGVVALLAIVLPQTLPWRGRPRLFRALVAAGGLIALTSVVAPVRGVQQLGAQALRAEATRAVADGTMTAGDAAAWLLRSDDLLSWRPRYSPLVANWRYAWQCLCGRFEDERGRPRRDGAATIEAVYGVAAVQPDQGDAPLHWADRQGRHLWWRFWGDLYGVPGWLLLLPFVVVGGGCAAAGFRRLAAAPAAPAPSDSAPVG